MNIAIGDSSLLDCATRGGWACPIFIAVCAVAATFLLFRAWRCLCRCGDSAGPRYAHPRPELPPRG